MTPRKAGHIKLCVRLTMSTGQNRSHEFHENECSPRRNTPVQYWVEIQRERRWRGRGGGVCQSGDVCNKKVSSQPLAEVLNILPCHAGRWEISCCCDGVEGYNMRGIVSCCWAKHSTKEGLADGGCRFTGAYSANRKTL
eukprot:356602-Chlamydomonas_euryale.AAC.8